jgi:RNA polymerase sigma-70 factor (ECF subfamily)
MPHGHKSNTMKNISTILSPASFHSRYTNGGVTSLGTGSIIGYHHNDDVLIALSLGGNKDAFEELVGRYCRRVFALVGKFFDSAEVIEEIALRIFARAFSSLASYRRTISFERWLSKIVFANCYEELRRREARGNSRLTTVTDEESAWLDRKMATGPFEAQFGDGERERAVEIMEKLLSRLSPETRLILVLRLDEKLALCEIAQLMGWSKLKMKVLAFRARHELRRTLSIACN